MEGSWSVAKRWRELLKAAKQISADQLQVLYKRDGLLALSKPYGVPVHSGPGMGKSVMDLMEKFKEIHNLKETPRLLHRLDKNTSGLLLLAYSESMAHRMSELFRDRKVVKTYLGLTCGVPKSLNGVVVDKICEGIVGKRKIRRMVTINDSQYEDVVRLVPDAEIMKAHTAYTVLDSSEDTCALVQYMTKTGIKHQIRLHSASSLQCPVLGDHKFSNFDAEPQQLPLRLLQMLDIRGTSSTEGSKRRIKPWQRGLIPLHLFAETVEIPEIKTDGKPLIIKAHLPEFFLETLKCCDLKPKRYGKTKYVKHFARR